MSTTFTPVSQVLVTELTYSEIIIGVVVALILVSLWQRALENLLFEVIGINRKSTFQTFIVAIGFTVIFFVFINIVQSLARDIILGMTGEAAASTQTGSIFGNSQRVQIINVDENKDCSCCIATPSNNGHSRTSYIRIGKSTRKDNKVIRR